MSKLADYQKRFTFVKFLIETHKYRELYKDKVGKFSILLAILFTKILCDYLIIDPEFLSKNIDPILISFSAGLIGLLGVEIAGLSIFMAMITPKALANLDKKGKIHLLVSIYFSFYFIGAIVLITILLLIIAYLRLPVELFIKNYFTDNIDSIYNIAKLYMFLLLFSFFFSISYTVALLGTCINFFFANIYMDKIKLDLNSEFSEDPIRIFIVKIRNKDK